MNQLKRALHLLETPEGFYVYLQAHHNDVQDNTILYFLVDYLKACGIEAKIWISTWPPIEVENEQTNIEIHWIVNLQQYFGQRLARPISGQEVLDALSDNPSTYSLIKLPPSNKPR